MAKLVATADKVLLRKDKPEKASKGGVLIPESAQRQGKSVVATVVSVGEAPCSCGADRTGPSAEAHDKTCLAEDHLKYGISVGDRVLVNQYCGHEVQYNGETLTVVNPREILAKIV